MLMYKRRENHCNVRLGGVTGCGAWLGVRVE